MLCVQRADTEGSTYIYIHVSVYVHCTYIIIQQIFSYKKNRRRPLDKLVPLSEILITDRDEKGMIEHYRFEINTVISWDNAAEVLYIY